METKSSLVRNLFTDSGDGHFATETRAFADMQVLKSLFFDEDWVYITVNTVGQTGSTVPLCVKEEQFTEDGKAVYTRADDHPVQSLLYRPNQWQDSVSFLYNVLIEYCLMGNAIIWYAKRNKQMVVLPAEKVELRFDNEGQLKSYLFHKDGYSFNGDQSIEIPKSDILHWRYTNPSSLYWGLSPFIPGTKSVLFNRYSQDYLNSFYLKGATPGVALKMDKNASEQSTLRLLKSFEMAHTGRRNQRRPMVLPKGVDIEMMDHRIADQNLSELIDNNMDKILNLLRIPKHVLSMAETGSLGSEEHKMAIRQFWTATLQPMINQFAGQLSHFFAETLGESHFIEADYSGVEPLQVNAAAKAEYANSLKEFFTVNEIREEVFEKEPIEGGDIFVSQRGSAAIPVEPEELETVDDEVVSDEDMQQEEISELSLNKSANIFSQYKAQIDNSVKQLLEEEQRRIGTMSELASNLFAEQARLALGIIRDHLTANQKADIPNKRELRKLISDAFEQLDSEFIDQYQQRLSGSVELGYDLQLDFILNDQNRDAIRELKERGENGRRRILQRRGIESFSQISKTSTEKVLQVLERGLENRLNPRDMAREVTAEFQNLSRSRAETIARTETLTAVSLGKEAMHEDAKEVIPDLIKVWINARDNRVRGNPDGEYPDSKADHWELQGEQITGNERFSNGLKYPREPGGPAYEVINCRCDVIAVAPEDLDDLSIPVV